MKRLIAFALLLNASLLVLAVHELVAIAGEKAVPSQNGDTNGDGERDIGDAIYYLRWLFQGGPEPVALAGGPDFSSEIRDLRSQIAVLRSDVDAGAVLIDSNRTAIEDLAADPGGGLSEEQAEILGHISMEQLPMDDEGNTVKTIRFSGVNVQVVNGTGVTGNFQNTGNNCLGNLIVGYQEMRPRDELWWTDDFNVRSGSHNLVVGSKNNYSIWGGQVVGQENSILGFFSTVSGGRRNKALGMYSTIGGGFDNLAQEHSSTVSGGNENTATGDKATVCGGRGNMASGSHSAISGYQNTASGDYSTVSGGGLNTASGEKSTVSGGLGHRALGENSTVSGGRDHSLALEDDQHVP